MCLLSVRLCVQTTELTDICPTWLAGSPVPYLGQICARQGHRSKLAVTG